MAEDTAQADTTEDENSLSELFNDTPEPEKVVEAKGEDVDAPPEVKAPELDIEAQSEDGSKDESEEPEEKPEVRAEPPSAEQGQLAALLAERQKRQEAERRLAELEGDEEPTETELPVDARERKLRIELSRDFISEVDPEYVKTYEPYFMSQVVNERGEVINEKLLQEFYESASPARFARDYAKEQIEIAQLRDPKFKESLKSELRKEVLAEIEAEADKLNSANVPNLAQATEDGSNSVAPEREAGLGDIFKDSPL